MGAFSFALRTFAVRKSQLAWLSSWTLGGIHTHHKNMKTSPLKPRLAVWQATHKQLLHTDARYRKRFYAYLTAVVCLSCILVVFYLPFFGIRLFAPAVDIAIILGLGAVVVGLTLRQFLFQNKCIKHYLSSSHAA